LILRKISKSDATRCQILRLKCTKFNFHWGSAPNPTGGAYSAPPDPLAVFNGPTSNGRETDEREEIWRGWEGEGKARGRKEKKMEGRRRPPTIFGLEAPLT